jgi:hypothetical protein
VLTQKPLVPNPAIWGNFESPAPPPPEPAKVPKKYLSLEEVEAQLLASQRPQQPAVPPPPQIPGGPHPPQQIPQQRHVEESMQPKPAQYQQPPQLAPQFPTPKGQYVFPPHGPPAPQRSPQNSSPQRSPVRQSHLPPSRPTSLTSTKPPPNLQEIMAAENQRLIAEVAKRRKRTEKLTEMVSKLKSKLI